MKKYICIILLFASSTSYAQRTPGDTLGELLKDKRNFKDIAAIVDAHYRNRPRGKGTGYNQWLRWLWFNRTRLDEAGNITNPMQKAEDALEELNARMALNPNRTTAGIPTWQLLGPTNYTSLANDYGWGLGRIDRIAFHPTDPTIFYVGTAMGGLWRTQNSGADWQHLTPELPLQSISGVVCSYADANTLYVITGDGEAFGYFNYMDASRSSGIYKSTNGGGSWSKVYSFSKLSPPRAYQLVQHPTNPQTLYACTSLGIYITTNGGQSWELENTGEIRDLKFHPQHPDIVYADANNSRVVLYYLPNQTTFQDINANNTGTDIFAKSGIAIAVSNNQPNTLMVIAGKSAGSAGQDFDGLYKCTFTYNNASPQLSGMNISLVRDAPNILGGSVFGTTDGGQASYDLCIALKPSDATKLITGGLCVWKSTDQGVNNITASTIYFYDPAIPKPYIHPDVHGVVYNPINNYLYALTDGGIYVSTDDGITWAEKTKGLNISQFYNIAGSESFPNALMGGTQDNGTFYRKTSSTNFRRVRGADGFSTAIHQRDTAKIYWTENQTLFKSTTGGNNIITLKTFPPVSFSDGIFPEVRLKLDYPDTLVAFNVDSMVISKNAGSTWNRVYSFGVRDFSFCGDEFAKAFFVSGAGAVRVCSDLFAATPTISAVAVPPPTGSYYKIITFPTYGNFVWIGSGNYSATRRVMFSDNGGTTAWQDKTGSLPALPINCMAVDLSGNVYVGTDIGVFVRGLSDADWTPFSNGLPRVPVTGLVINNGANLLRVSTLGLGLWSTSLLSACNANESITGSYIGQYYFQASSALTTSASIGESEGTSVMFKAGSSVVMVPGFIASKGSVMRAMIGGCNTGIPSTERLTDPRKMMLAKPVVENLEEVAPSLEKIADKKQLQKVVVKPKRKK